MQRALFGVLASLLSVSPPVAQEAGELHGRIERAGELRIVRLWGSAEERGYAHGRLLAAEIRDLIRLEYGYRFGVQPELLAEGRRALPRLITYPDAVRTEIEALFRGLADSEVDLDLPRFDRKIDLDDLLFVNALDVFASLACSGFTVWNGMVEGGGVLTTRNFDWPLSGPHMVDSVVLLVQEPDTGNAFAAVTWPGYVGVVTGVNEDGVATFLHVGSGDPGLPEPDSMPTAIASREVLQHAEIETLRDVARRTLDETSPPSSYITRFVMPCAPDAAATPVAVFETDLHRVVARDRELPCVVTNHFTKHRGGRDSRERYETITHRVARCLDDGDHKVSVEEAWDALRAVDRSGGFATLHSLVFRADPWLFELAVGEIDDEGRAIAAPRSSRRFALSRDAVFARGR